jgi:hypothetical protein
MITTNESAYCARHSVSPSRTDASGTDAIKGHLIFKNAAYAGFAALSLISSFFVSLTPASAQVIAVLNSNPIGTVGATTDSVGYCPPGSLGYQTSANPAFVEPKCYSVQKLITLDEVTANTMAKITAATDDLQNTKTDLSGKIDTLNNRLQKDEAAPAKLDETVVANLLNEIEQLKQRVFALETKR